MALASLCTARILKDYFNDGVLPLNGTVCDVDEELFPPSEDFLLKNVPIYTSKDMDLLNAVRHVGDHILPLRI